MPDDAKPSSAIQAAADDAKRYWLDEGWAPGGYVRQVDFAAHSKGVHPLFQGIRIIDCDTHFTEPPDLFTKNAPAAMKAKMPHVKRSNEGHDRWWIGETDLGSIGGNVIAPDHNKLLGRLASRD